MADNELKTPATLVEGFEKWAEMAKDPALGDDWRVKILRRETQNALPETVAIFDDVQLEHLVNLETWLVPLSGGGPYYQILVTHAKMPEKLQGSINNVRISGEKKAVDPRIVKSPGWAGPKTMRYPNALPSQEGGGASPESGRAAVADGQRGPAPASPTDVTSLLAELSRRERALDDKRHQAEIDALRRENEAAQRRAEEKLRDMEAKIGQAQARPGPDVIAIVTALGSVLAPVIVKVMENSAEEKKRLLEVETRRLELEAARAAAEKGRPLIPPEIMDLVKSMKAEAADQARSLSSVFDAQAQLSRQSQESQATMMRTMLQTVSTAIDLGLGNRGGEAPEEPWVKVLTEGMRSLGALAEASKMRQSVPALKPPPAQAQPQRAKANGAKPPPAAVPSPEPVPADTGAAPAMAGPPTPTLDDVERMIRARRPAKETIDALFDAVEFTPGVREEIARAGGIPDLLEARLTPPWLEANISYVQELANEIGDDSRRERMAKLGFDVEEMAEEQEQEQEEGTDA